MLRRTALAATALLAAGALLLTACTGGGPASPSATGTPDPDASAVIRLVLEPGNLDIRQTAGSALDQILDRQRLPGARRAAPRSRTSCPPSRATGRSPTTA